LQNLPNPSSHLLTIPPQQPLSPIFSILSSKPRSLAKYCQAGGFVVRPVVSPTVPVGTERVRVCLHAGNAFDEVDKLARRMGEWVELETEKARRAIEANKARL
jgi:8-amino-7-oxononanoate synthase